MEWHQDHLKMSFNRNMAYVKQIFDEKVVVMNEQNNKSTEIH